jgi:hypothetical protein
MVNQVDFIVCVIVTPAKAGVHHQLRKFQLQVMDSRLRGNDEVSGLV